MSDDIPPQVPGLDDERRENLEFAIAGLEATGLMLRKADLGMRPVLATLAQDEDFNVQAIARTAKNIEEIHVLHETLFDTAQRVRRMMEMLDSIPGEGIDAPDASSL